MSFKRSRLSTPWRAGLALSVLATAGTMAAMAEGSSTYVVTSTNDANSNSVVVFKLNTGSNPSLSWVKTMPTGGKGGASGNAGILQFNGTRGAVANFGSNTVSELVRHNNSFAIGKTIPLAQDCLSPDSVALTDEHLYVVGTNCAESHGWPAGNLEGHVVSLGDSSAAQIAVGKTWAAVTLKSGSVLELPLTKEGGSLDGASNMVTLPDDANDTPLGEAFWDNVLGFTPAHSPDSFAIVDQSANVFPIAGPTPSFPTNAPCWVAKGPRSVWYTANSPGHAISIFFSDSQGGAFYKSVALPGSPTDITVSADHNWLAVIYTVNGSAYVAMYSVDEFGDLKWMANSSAIGVASFNGVAISQ